MESAVLRLTVFCLLWFSAEANSSVHKCRSILKPEFGDCSNLKQYDHVPGECSPNKACQKKFTSTAINVEPFLDILQHVMFSTVETCCGGCKKMTSRDQTLVAPSNISMSLMNTTNFVYPILGIKSEKSIYGYHFIPIVELSSGYYITRAVTSSEVMATLIRSCLNLWPLLLIIVLLALISGFVMWISDTWFNEDDFSRRFVYGWMDGFWWSFVSMTTVGYGDKIPKNALSRIFSVFWILVGVTIVAIFTGALTNEITSAANPGIPDMHGKNVGVLKYRTFDASFVAKHGGIVKETKGVTEKDNIGDLKRLLSTGEVDGIFLDMYTYMHTVTYARSIKGAARSEDTDVAAFFLDQTYRVKWSFEGERMAYGILVEHEDDYEYFEEFVKHNQAIYETCSLLRLNEMEEKAEADHDIFSPDGGVFYDFLYGCLGLIITIVAFGLVYEYVLYNKRKGVKAVPT